MGEKIFVSHSGEDAFINDTFVNDILISGLGFHPNDIVDSSIKGLGISSGEEWRKALQKYITNSTVVVMLITPNYLKSHMCLNEMGAAWVLSKNIIPLIIDPISYEDLELLDILQIERLNDSISLDNVKNRLEEIFINYLKRPKDAWWNSKKQQYISTIEDYLEENSFEMNISREEFNKCKQDSESLKENYKSLLKEKRKLETYAKELENCKSVEEVNTSRKKLGMSSNIDEFNEKVEDIKQKLKQFPEVLLTILFNSYTRRNFPVDYGSFRKEIEEAISNEYIDEEYNVYWNENTILNIIKDQLSNISNIISELDEYEYEDLINKYKVNELRVYRKDFWENVFDLKF